MKEASPQVIKLSDYKESDYLIEKVDLTFELHDTRTTVTNVMQVKAAKENQGGTPLVLDGEELELVSLKINGELVRDEQFKLEEESLTIFDVPKEFTLEIVNTNNPIENKALDGLYKSGDIFCTQCEAQGFRRITYYLDRPDVMAKFTTKIIADKEKFPVLLSNGNPIGNGELENGLHWVKWEDPFLKPAYLYALVAGDLALVQDSFTTMSGRKIDLRIYVDKGNENKCAHAMESLKKSMKWDEDTYGLEYDLDIYMIVAVDSFNMGAMENKGLNIFNSAYVLANPETATDMNFYDIEAVIGHEYFHNWTGNRITCRDWFQLTLKEGLTVFRDQEFSADMNARSVKRIDDVNALRARQFAEDAGPQSHPIKPSSYIEINNFYTLTVYEKGAEVIRMIHTLLGKEGFRKGMDKYFELFDGQAVTTEDFIHAMSIANDNYDFEQFKNWYNQAGTPLVEAIGEYDEQACEFKLKLTQSSKNQNDKPFHIPLSLGLVGEDGSELYGELLHLKEVEQEFTFKGITKKPVMSINRDFTAPIRLKTNLTDDDLSFLMGKDTNEFNRYESGNIFSKKVILDVVKEIESGNDSPQVDERYVKAIGEILKDNSIEDEFKGQLLTPVTLSELFQEQETILIESTVKARKHVRKSIATTYKSELLSLFNSLNKDVPYRFTPEEMGRRNLKTVVLSYLMYVKDEQIEELCYNSFKKSNNMSEEISTLSLLVNFDSKFKDAASDTFYKKWKDVTLVIQKWLQIWAMNDNDDCIERIQKLEKDEVYDKTVPNIVRSLIGVFGHNHNQFHHESGRGYKFYTDKIMELDGINPQVAARMTQAFNDAKRMPSAKKAQMKEHLERIITVKGLSKNVFEIATNILKGL